jgi:hypothetical protein
MFLTIMLYTRNSADTNQDHNNPKNIRLGDMTQIRQPRHDDDQKKISNSKKDGGIAFSRQEVRGPFVVRCRFLLLIRGKISSPSRGVAL